jgi:hypothetical protein
MLVGSVAAFAGEALAAAADGIAFFALPRINYLVFTKAAEWT